MEEVERSQLLMPRDLPPVLPEATGSYTAGLSAGQQHGQICTLEQWYPTFLAPGTSFMEDKFSTDKGPGSGFRMIQAHYIYCAFIIITSAPPQIIRH